MRVDVEQTSWPKSELNSFYAVRCYPLSTLNQAMIPAGSIQRREHLFPNFVTSLTPDFHQILLFLCVLVKAVGETNTFERVKDEAQPVGIQPLPRFLGRVRPLPSPPGRRLSVWSMLGYHSEYSVELQALYEGGTIFA